MNVIVRLLTFYEYSRKWISRPIGEIFPNKGEAFGLQMLAEFIARMGENGIAAILLTSNRSENLIFMPSGKYDCSFKLNNKVSSLQEDRHFVIVMQRELHLFTGNYVAIKMPFEGNSIDLYHILDKNNKAVLVTSFNLSYLENQTEILRRAFQIVLEEVDTVAGNKHKKSSQGL